MATLDNDSSGSSLPHAERVKTEGFGRNPAGLHIEIRQAGPRDGAAVFCLHGIGSNATGYAAQLAGLSGQFRVIAWNAPGYGNSDSLPTAAPEPEDYAHALFGLMQALGIGAAAVIGSSFGGVIAAYFAALYPDAARAVVLSAPAAGNARLDSAERQRQLSGRIDDMRSLGPVGVADKRSTFLVAPTAPPDVVAAAHRLVSATNPEGYIQAAHVLDAADTIAIAARVRAPALVLVGSEDKVTPAATCARPIHARLAAGELQELQGIGHLVKLEAPQRFNELVGDFFARHGIT